MKHLLRSTSIALALSMLAAACGGGDDVAPTTDPQTTTAAPTTTVAVTTTTAAPTTTVAPATTTTVVDANAGPEWAAGSVPAGYELFDGSEDGYTIALPENWLPLDLTDEDLATIAEEGGALFEGDAADAMLEQVAIVFESGGSMMAFDPASSLVFVTNLNILAFPPEPLPPADFYEQIVAAQYESIGGSLLEIGDVRLIAGDAIYTKYVLELGQGIGTVTGEQYLVEGVNGTYVVTFSTRDLDRDKGAFDGIIDTFRTGT